MDAIMERLRIPKLVGTVADRLPLKLYEQWNTSYTTEELVFVVRDLYHLDQILVETKAEPDLETVKKKYFESKRKMIDLLNQQRISRIENVQIEELMQGTEAKPMSEDEKHREEEISTWKINHEKIHEYKLVTAEKIDCWKTTLDFTRIEHYLHIEGGLGSSGVFILDVENEGLLVMKEGAKAEAVLTAHLLGNVLGNRGAFWTIPECRLITMSSDQFKVMFDRLMYLEPLRTKKKGYDVPKFKKMSKLGQFLIMQFIVGTGICNIPETLDFKDIFSPETLQSLGRSLIYDMILNNWDRVPVKGIWNNDGNPSNLMFNIQKLGSAVSGEAKDISVQIILIDQTVNPIKVEKNRQTYINNLKKFASSAIKELESFQGSYEEDEKKTTVMSSLREFIQFNTVVGHDIGIKGEIEVLNGFCAAIKKLVEDETEDMLSPKAFADMRLRIYEWSSGDPAIVENHVIQESIEFASQCVDALREGGKESLRQAQYECF